ncbi:MAG: DUF4065 domain-containing protein [Acidobacteriaceae bacterium]|nr:DUF4065 domain-containing protein [Acidobacteriaceae bacterium]
MASVFDVAAYILEKAGPMSAMKLQKLVYYSQAWSLVWDDRPLLKEPIQAWANGPVAPALYRAHRGQFQVSSISNGNAHKLTQDERETVDAVLEFYGAKSSQWLSDLTHQEEPWINARIGYRDGEICENEITPAAMAEYYGSL